MVGAPSAPSQSARTTGWPSVWTSRGLANASWPASQSAAARMVGGRASRLTLGTATYSLSSHRYPASPGSKESTATVDRDRLPGDPGGPLRHEELHAVGDVRRVTQAPGGDALDQEALPLLAVALPLALAGRVGPDESRCDAVDRDPERPELLGHLPGEPDLARLRAGVGLDPGLADGQPGRRRDVDDAAPAPLLHPGHDRPGAQERAGQVGVEDREPVGGGDALHRVPDL